MPHFGAASPWCSTPKPPKDVVDDRAALFGPSASATVLWLERQQVLHNALFRLGEIGSAQSFPPKLALKKSVPCASIAFALWDIGASARERHWIFRLSGDEEVYRQKALALAAHYLDGASP